VRDFRVATVQTADAFAEQQYMIRIRKPLFIFRGVGPTIAVYIFGKRIYQKGWLK